MHKWCLVFTVIFFSGCKHTPETLSSAEAAPSTSLSCGDKVSNNSCAYYTCLQADFQCHPDDYPLGYGKRYCERFQNLCDGKLNDPRIKSWIAGTTKCLQYALEVRRKQLASCDEVETYAFDSHPTCYASGSVRNGGISFCSLGPLDWVRIRTSCFNLPDIWSPLGLKQMAKTAILCGGMFAGDLLLGEQPSEELAPDPETQAKIDSMSAPEREARAQEFRDFADQIMREIGEKPLPK